MSALKSDLQVAPQEIYANAVTTQGTDLGARATTGDGRVFRYCSVGTTAMVAGKIYQGQAILNWTNLSIAAAGTLTTTVTTTSTLTVTANQLAGGTLSVRDAGAGQGFSYRIKSHPAATAAVVTFTLEDPLQNALTTSDHIDVLPSPYSSVILAPTTLTGPIAGVAVCNAAASDFAWLQTRGICPVLSDASAPGLGVFVGPSTVTAGAMAAAAGTQAIIGHAAILGVSAKYTPVFLQIE